MNKIANSVAIRPVENFLLRFDAPPWDTLYRAAIGFAAPSVLSRLWGEDRSGWALVVLLLGILAALRLVPAVMRKLVPVSGTVKRVWQERRQLAKRFDSYQWRKLFGLGVGLSLNMAISSHIRVSTIMVSVFCLLSGALGLIRWHAVAPRLETTGVDQKQVGHPA